MERNQNARWLACLALWATAATGAVAGQGAPGRPATVNGTVVTRGGAVAVIDAGIQAVDAAGRTVASTRSDESGRFVLSLGAGEYRLRASRPQYREREIAVTLAAGTSVAIELELDVAGVDEVVTVSPPTLVDEVAARRTSLSQFMTAASMEDFSVGGDPLAAAHSLAVGIAIRGGPPYQAAVNLGRASLTDAGGEPALHLPWEAVRSVEVLPNPYAVEFGGFSSGVTVIDTKSGGDRWRARLNNFVPSLRTERGALQKVLGIERFSPQLSFSGPIGPRLRLAQSFEYRWEELDVRSRPESDVRTTRIFGTFTRLDVAAGRHAFTISAHAFPQRLAAITLGTFTPPEAAADLDLDTTGALVTHTVALTSSDLVDTTVRISEHVSGIGPRAYEAVGMSLAPSTTSGRYFVTQHRRLRSQQWLSVWTRSQDGRGGTHLFKAGIDVEHRRFDGSQQTAPLTVLRSNGSRSRLLAFSGPAAHHASAIDTAVFVQDNWTIGRRWQVDGGTRVDRDGVLQRTNLTVRGGVVVALNEAGTAAVRAGAGAFFERTPLTIATFEAGQSIIDTGYADDGLTPLSPPATLRRRAAVGLQTPRSVTWSAGYTHALTSAWFLRLNAVVRRARHGFLVHRAPAAGTMTVDSDGRASYREVETGLRYTRAAGLEVEASYTWSHARADQTFFGDYFGVFQWPIVGAAAYTRASGDTPHQLAGRLRAMPRDGWLLVATGYWRSGRPYSALDQFLDPLPPQNGYSMPARHNLDLSVERRVRVLGRQPWLGIRIHNLLHTGNDVDVQRRLDAPDFGATFNSVPRQYRLQVRFR